MVALLVWFAPAPAQVKDIDINAHNDVDGVTVELTLQRLNRFGQDSFRAVEESNPVELKVGDQVRICFKASRAGFVTLWQNREDSNQRVERKKLYPKGSGSMPAAKDQEICPLSDGGRWGFQVIGESREAEIIAFWTPDEASQWSDEAYPKVRTRSIPEAGYVSRTLRYRATK
jgi:hypothetical protein